MVLFHSNLPRMSNNRSRVFPRTWCDAGELFFAISQKSPNQRGFLTHSSVFSKVCDHHLISIWMKPFSFFFLFFDLFLLVFRPHSLSRFDGRSSRAQWLIASEEREGWVCILRQRKRPSVFREEGGTHHMVCFLRMEWPARAVAFPCWLSWWMSFSVWWNIPSS